MWSLIYKGVNFIKKNPTIIYSFFLIIVVSAIIFFNTYYSVIKFQKNNDTLLHSKAILAEDIFNLSIADEINNENKIQSLIEKIKDKDDEILEINILKPKENKDEFKIIASTDKSKINKSVANDIIFIAWQHPQEGIAYLMSDHSLGRFWEISKTIQSNGKKEGIVTFDMSLSDSDKLINQTIKRMYWVSIASLLIVLLLVVNHTRLFKYAVRVTKLEEVDKMKDDFISMASHELKMPLTIINGYAELLKDSLEKKSSEKNTSEFKERLKHLKNIKIASKRLRELVEDILDVSRIEQGKLKINLEKVNLSEILNEVMEQFQIDASKKKISLKLKNNLNNELWIKADEARVKQILVNLVGNAIKYTPQGSVTVKTEIDKDFIKIVVKDTGIGMSAQEMKNLFKKFYRIKNKKTEAINGTGLGLWISKELALKMKGDLTVESMSGVGSQFILTLPKFKE